MVGKEEKRSASIESGTDIWRDLPSSANLEKEHTEHMEQRSSFDQDVFVGGKVIILFAVTRVGFSSSSSLT